MSTWSLQTLITLGLIAAVQSNGVIAITDICFYATEIHFMQYVTLCQENLENCF